LSAVYGLYSDPESAQQALENLRAAGAADRDITVVSSEPFEEYEFSHRDKATWIYWSSGVGGAIGLLAGYLLTSMTERDWPLPTGGMPIVAPWPNLVIMFEMTMLFAILATVGTLLVTTKLPRRQPKMYDAEVADGKILVGIEEPSLPVEKIEQALTIQPGTSIKTIAL
jgi:Protein of unknown function (DUF3341)